MGREEGWLRASLRGVCYSYSQETKVHILPKPHKLLSVQGWESRVEHSPPQGKSRSNNLDIYIILAGPIPYKGVQDDFCKQNNQAALSESLIAADFQQLSVAASLVIQEMEPKG